MPVGVALSSLVDINLLSLTWQEAGRSAWTMFLTHPETAELVKRVPAERQARFYRLAIWPDLFGGFSLAREYGRIGQDGRLRLDHHPDIEAAGDAFADLFRQKQRRGYALLADGTTG